MKKKREDRRKIVKVPDQKCFPRSARGRKKKGKGGETSRSSRSAIKSTCSR